MSILPGSRSGVQPLVEEMAAILKDAKPLDLKVKDYTPLPVEADKIPRVMQNVARWVAWKLELPGNRKVPWSHSGTKRASGENFRNAWTQFDKANHCYANRVDMAPPSRLAGLGFVFDGSDEIIGVDLDDCRSIDGQLAPWATKMIELLGFPYTEISPSGTGVKAYLRARLSFHDGSQGKNFGMVEVYASGRWFAVTGHRLEGTAIDIVDRTEQAQALLDACVHVFSKPLQKAPTTESIVRSHGKSEHDVVERARRYLAKLPPSISGNGGHNAAMVVARALCWGFGLDHETAFGLFAAEFNPRCEPPWSDGDIRHKLRDGAKDNSNKPFGWLRDSRRGRSRTGQRPDQPLSECADQQDPSSDRGRIANHFGSGQDKFGIGLDEISKTADSILGEWPKVTAACNGASGTLFTMYNGEIRFLEKSPSLFGWMAAQAEVLWSDGAGCITKSEFFEHLHYHRPRFESVETTPHFPPMPGAYYLHPKIVPGDGSVLDKFLAFFRPATDIDAQLMRAFLMQLCWGGPCGKRPAWLITGPDMDELGGRGVGKTTFVEKCARLVGGMIAINDPAGAKSDDLERRLLTPSAKIIRVVCIDNLKTLKFSWAFIEAAITADVISGRQMFVGEGRRPNSLTWVITANGASLSRDMAQRCNVLKLDRPTYRAGDWDQAIDDFIDKHRWDIIADVAATFARPTVTLAESSRWGLFTRDIIGRLENPGDVQAAILRRAAEYDEDAEEASLVREGFENVIRQQGLRPELVRVKFSPRAIAAIVEATTGERRATNKATAYVKQLQLPEFGGHSRDGGRWYYWQGRDADPNERPTVIADVDVATVFQPAFDGQ